MKNSIRVSVTQRDIDKGEPICDNRCPIALAISRTVKRRVGVTYGAVYLLNEVHQMYELTPTAERFIRRFDNGQPVQPFTFTMRPV
jgi:hypothetical protein